MATPVILAVTNRLYAMDSGFGVPVGVVVFVLLIVKMMQPPDTGRSRSRSFRFRSLWPKEHKPVDWEKHWAEQAQIKKAKDEKWQREMADWRKRR